MVLYFFCTSRTTNRLSVCSCLTLIATWTWVERANRAHLRSSVH